MVLSLWACNSPISLQFCSSNQSIHPCSYSFPGDLTKMSCACLSLGCPWRFYLSGLIFYSDKVFKSLVFIYVFVSENVVVKILFLATWRRHQGFGIWLAEPMGSTSWRSRVFLKFASVLSADFFHYHHLLNKTGPQLCPDVTCTGT